MATLIQRRYRQEVNFVRRHWFIIALIAVMAAVRFVVLTISQTHVHSDEAIIGLMAKHISEGRYFPFYMYGQPYNASASGEAYLAAILFKLFGVGVVPLKSVIVLLSLVCVALFYKMAGVLFDRRTAMFSTLVFALAPSLLKWHFQVRGYSFYFLAIPILVILFWRIANSCSHGPVGRLPSDNGTSSAATRDRRVATTVCLLFGLASGLSLWLLELSLTLNAALWLLLLVWRKMSIKQWALASGAFVAGYAPAIIYNFTHNFANWETVFLNKAGGSLGVAISGITRPANLRHIFITELPKFFGPDTVLWYYQEKPWMGWVFYAIAACAVIGALVPFTELSNSVRSLFSGRSLDSEQSRDIILLFLTASCFVPYLLSPVPTASYFLGALFFLAVLMGRLLGRLFANPQFASKAAGVLLLVAILGAGIGATVRVAGRNEIETLTLCDGGQAYCMTRIPGADISGVERHLQANHATAVWTTVSFTYPLLFETRETIAISDAIFGWNHNLYPSSIPLPQPSRDQPGVYVLEFNSPMIGELINRLTETSGAQPTITKYGTMGVIEQATKE